MRNYEKKCLSFFDGVFEKNYTEMLLILLNYLIKSIYLLREI